MVAGAFDVRGAQGVGLFGAVFQFGFDGECCLDAQRGQGRDEQNPDLGVEAVTGQDGADRGGGGDADALADVAGDQPGTGAVVAHGHPLPAAAAEDQAL